MTYEPKPAELLDAKHDDPDPTGPLTDYEPEPTTAATVTHTLDVVRVRSSVPGTPPESWVARCECGWQGHPRYSASEAISDYGWHR